MIQESLWEQTRPYITIRVPASKSSCGLSRRDYVKKKGKCNVKKPVNELIYKATHVHCTQDHYSKSLKIAQFNAQGLCTKYNDYMEFMCTNDIDVCAITEMWLSNDIGDSEFLPNGYQTVRKDRDNEFYPDGCLEASSTLRYTGENYNTDMQHI